MIYPIIPVAQAQPPALATMFPILLLFVIFYFLIFKPQKQKQEDHRKMISSLEKNNDCLPVAIQQDPVSTIPDILVADREDETHQLFVRAFAIDLHHRVDLVGDCPVCEVPSQGITGHGHPSRPAPSHP